jgi:putative peptidoglycan lipid II flippase
MTPRDAWRLARDFWTTSLGTLASRVLGLVRDMATAALLGLGEGGVMDALVVAFRVPNLLRRIFGEGALAASFLPVFSQQFEVEPRRGWQLLSVLLAWLAVVLTAVVVVGEALCAIIWWRGGAETAGPLLGLTAVMLPYLVFICLAAQVSAALQARFEFRVPALAPLMLNVCWLAAVWFVAPSFAPDKVAQAYGIAAAILLSGVLQLAVQVPALARLGFRWSYDWPASRLAFWQVVRAMAPVTLGLAVTQLNTLTDSLIAWGLSAAPGAGQTIPWLPGELAYPLETGAAAAIYYGERFYQLPVGLLGIAVATVIYPRVSAHAARGDLAAVAGDLSLGLRLVMFLAVPASVGIMLVAEPLVRVLFERGAFTADDSARASHMIATYAAGVWAYCAIPVLVRGYYAVGNRAAPARLGAAAVALNLALNLALVWPLAEVGLAVSTAAAAIVQVVALAVLFGRDGIRLAWRELAATALRILLASGVMTLVVLAVQRGYPLAEDTARAEVAVQLALAIAAGAAAYLLTAWLTGATELALLLRRNKRPD